MKADLDRFMEADGIDAIVILPHENEDPYRTYLANGAHFGGMVVKKRGEQPVLIANGMEVDEAAKSGLTVYSWEDFGLGELLREHKDDRDGAMAEWFRRIFEKTGVQGSITIYGVGDINAAYRTILLLTEHLGEQITIVPAKIRNNIFNKAYETKDTDEIVRLRDVARRTSAVMRATREWISTHRAAGEVVVTAEAAPLTIGDVKRYVRMQLFAQGLEDPEGMIFAQGRDAAVPHSKGEDDQPLTLGQTIVFDLFPREPGGYFHDMTRTWCIGHAPDEVQADFDAVLEVYQRSAEMCKVGVVTSTVQRMVCEFFEEKGHPTVLNTPGTSEGYVHSLAHGLGLNVHEAPYFPNYSEDYRLQKGSVFTLEPGLYYPDKGYGIRIEDTVFLNESGALETLTDCPYDLVIELNG
ncbi:MAG: aminopeptidase P family protein [Chloroflexi bacterium]|nr:aminopeptidase P family protein [Chloroflexota bacterium]